MTYDEYRQCHTMEDCRETTEPVKNWYRVTVREITLAHMVIHAESETAAIEGVREGEGNLIEPIGEYDSTLDPDTWTVSRCDSNGNILHQKEG